MNQKKILVGLTYDLRTDYLKMGYSEEETAEFDKIETVEGIENALHMNGFQTERIGNVRALIEQIQLGKKWDIVFNICEGLYGIGREAQVPAVLDIYKIPYTFSDVMVLSLTLHKAMTKRVIRDLGIPTADFFVAYKTEDIKNVKLPYPLFAKPVAEGTGKGINANSKITSEAQLKEVVSDLLKKFKQPVLIETFLPGREFTVGIAGTGEDARVTGMMEVIYKDHEPTKIYSYENKENYQTIIEYTVPEKEIYEMCSKVALDAWIGLECCDGGRIDIRMDAGGIPNFIEVNPLAGLNPVHSDLPILSRMQGISYEQLIGLIMKSAIKRYNL